MALTRSTMGRGLLSCASAGLITLLVLGSLLVTQSSQRLHHASASIALPRESAMLNGLLGSDSSMGSAPRSHVLPGLFQRLVWAHRHQVARPAASCANAPAPGYLHTNGNWIEDVRGCHVRLAGATWYGMQTTLYEPAGLDYLPYTTIVALIKQYGFNSVRIPYSNTMVEQNSSLTISSKYIGANKGLGASPNLKGLHPLQMLDLIVKACQSVGLMVILDDHFSHARSPSSYGVESRRPAVSRPAAEPDNWSGEDYISTTAWINDWLNLTNRYSPATPCGQEACGANPVVIGFDLRNEPHTDFVGKKHAWGINDYLNHGATWGPYPSKSYKPLSNWETAATKGGDAILAVNPHLLMFVEGVQLYPDPTKKNGVETYWWGSILRGVSRYPVKFTVSHQLVYSPHEWGSWKCCDNGQFSKNTSYKSLSKVFTSNWAFILHSKNPRVKAPIWLGEFNTCNTNKKCAANSKKGSQGQWFQIIVEFLKKNPEIGWSYYPINGTTSFDQPSDNSLLGPGWQCPKVLGVWKALKTIEPRAGSTLPKCTT